MDPYEIAERLGREVIKGGRRGFNSDGNRRLYTAAVVDLVASIVVGRDSSEVEMAKAGFYDYIQGDFLHGLGSTFDLQGNVEMDPQNFWHGPFVLPIFTNAAMAFLNGCGYPIGRDRFFSEFARYSLRPSKDDLLKGLKFFGPEMLFKGMARANSNFTTLTKVSARFNWGRRIKEGVSEVQMVRRSRSDYVQSLQNVLGDLGARAVLGGDCLLTLEMYRTLLTDADFYGKEDAKVVHADIRGVSICEGLGAGSCLYLLEFEPSMGLPRLFATVAAEKAFSIISRFGSRGVSKDQLLLEAQANNRRLTGDLREANAQLEDANVRLEEANVNLEAANTSLDKAHGALLGKYDLLTRQHYAQLQLQEVWSGFRDGEIHDAKNDFEGVHRELYLMQRHMLDYSCALDEGFSRSLAVFIIKQFPGIRKKMAGARAKMMRDLTEEQRRVEMQRRLTIGDYLGFLDQVQMDNVFLNVPYSGLPERERDLFLTYRQDFSDTKAFAGSGLKKLLVVLRNVTPQQKLARVSYGSFWDELESKMVPHCRGIDFQVAVEDVELEVYPGQLDLAYVNLLRNAAQAVREHPSDRDYVHVAGSLEGDIYRTVVSNSGPDTSLLVPKLISGEVYSGRDGGTATGLPVARDIVRKHMGRMDFNAIETGGLEVIIDLPIRK